jgi:hypothetical protein
MTHFFSSLFAIPPELVPVVESIGTVWGYTWWIVLPLVTGILAWEAWRLYLHVRFIHRLDLQLLEIKIPKNVLKTPKAMEQIFAAAHAPYSYGYRFTDMYWKGLEEYWMSFELVGRAGETHFYLRVPKQFRNMMESAIYSQYPEAEITEAEDYIESMPEILPNKDFDVAGFEEVLRRENYRPIRTYIEFEDPVEERRVDTMGTLLEAMSKLRDDEQLWLQVIVTPTGEAFAEEGKKAIIKLLGIEEPKEKKGGLFPDFDLGISLAEVLRAPFEHPGEAKSKREESRDRQLRFLVATHDKELAELIQKKITKLAFESTIRFIYVERRGAPTKPEHMNSIHGFIRQFNTNDINQLKPDKATTTAGYAVRGIFKKKRLHWRKRLIYEHYRKILPAHHKSILNIEELATLFHFPTVTITTTELEKVGSKKGTPPASLPVIE